MCWLAVLLSTTLCVVCASMPSSICVTTLSCSCAAAAGDGGDWWWMKDQVVDWQGTQWLMTTLVGMVDGSVPHTHTRGDGCGLVVARVLTPESTGVVVVVGQCGEHVATWMAWVPPRVAQGLMATPHHNHACATPWSLCKPSTPLAWWWCAPCPALALVCV